MAGSLNEEDLTAHGRDVWTKFNVAYEVLEKNGSSVSKYLDASALRAEMQRFHLWAINLGLYRQDHNSLDYRLRDNEVVKSFTRELVISLIEALDEITSIVSPSDRISLSTVSQSPYSDATRAENEELPSLSDDEGLSTGPFTSGSLNDESGSMLTLHFEDVTEAIDQLYNIASQIRNPRIRKYRTDVDLFKDVDDEIKSEYIRLRKTAELQGIEQIILQSRKLLLNTSQLEEADPGLTEGDQHLIHRLQRANQARRQQFEYWRRSKKRSIQAASKAIEPMLVPMRGVGKLEHGTPSLVQSSEVTRSVLSSAPALSKSFMLERQRSTYSGTSRGLTTRGPSGERVDWPKPPVAGPRAEDFECPFCFYFCGSRYSGDAAWRSHLKHDLRPYVCTYGECTEPNVLYENREEWIRHEQWAHQQRIWRCSEHPQHEYFDRDSYGDHVKTFHAASMHQLLSPELLDSQESVSQVCDRPCPFCQREFERPLDLGQHIAGHLESIALLSLPNLEDIDKTSEGVQANSNSANRNYAESKVGDFEHTEPLLFPENDLSESVAASTIRDQKLFESKLKAESVSFDSLNEVNVEACQAYSSELAAEWLSRLPNELDEVYKSHTDPSEPLLKKKIDPEDDTVGSLYQLSKVSSLFSQNAENQSAEDQAAGKREVLQLSSPTGLEIEVERPADEQGSPVSILVSSEIAQQAFLSSSHWLVAVISKQSLKRTPLEMADMSSACFGEHQPDIVAKLEERFDWQIELKFDNGDLIVRIYLRPGGKNILFCRTLRPMDFNRDSAIPLSDLTMTRSGSFLNFKSLRESKMHDALWARVRFSYYEDLVMFHCSFLALRSFDDQTPSGGESDWSIEGEELLYAGSIIENNYKHVLRLFREGDTGVIRLQASVSTGMLERTPIWTAFITHKIHIAGWASKIGRWRIRLADLQQHIFTNDYQPPKISADELELTFVLAIDAEQFFELLSGTKQSTIEDYQSSRDEVQDVWEPWV